ncbi:aldehyde dehydrogenase family protein [Jatrophihabitans cynanchi]|uniref:Aldehyde dehydrogenase n=1 Tax=Jatrophihabitans cynanchi TaxID=2944128 RepID=A0ABY7K2T4_9ACTN|nr:aldehyde dehydrogenase family protein [Jatrophihabitans sp. SB3-54]WAX57872.1 aldehyde dehydrogenase family protein [Jatrophihabitans sp. SB3-54]
MTAQLRPDAVTAQTFDLTNPATGELVGSYPVHSAEDVAGVVAAARAAQVWWAELGYAGRKQRLTRWVSWLAKHSDEICELGFRETGKPKGDVQFELMAGLDDIRWAARNAERVLKRRRVRPGAAMMNFEASVEYLPLGVAGVIAPWNFPFYTPLCGMAYALAAGNAAVVKPSEFSTATGVYAVESFHRANPDAPAGLVGWVSGFGPTGAALCNAGVDKIAFTGSVPTGRRVMQACSATLTPVLLELGGKDATIVAADADLDAAADALTWGGFWHAGQACVGVERVYVVESVREEFLRRMKERAERITVGLDELADYGPMTMPGQIDIVRRHVSDALERGGTALVGGLESIKAPYVHPIVLVDVPEDSAAVREETFGPVIVINTVPDVDEAVRRANASDFHLASSVFSASHGEQIAARLHAGGTTINSVMTFVGIPSLPFGGVGDSGFGRFHGDDGLREFSRPKATTRKKFGMGRELQQFPRAADQYKIVRRVLRLRFARRVKR